jgi:hypothetical protein
VFTAVFCHIGFQIEAEGSECPMIAEISGDAKIAEDIRKGLFLRGVFTAATADCPGIKVTALSVEKGISLNILDTDGRRARRIATDTDSAINQIDSRVRQGLTTPPLLPGEAETTGPVVVSPPVPPLNSPVAAIAVSALFGAEFDAAIVFGARASVTFFLGPISLGPSLSIQADPHLTGESKKTGTSRSFIDLLAFIEYPAVLKRIGLRPGVDIGVSFLSAHAVQSVTLSSSDDAEEADDESVSSVSTSGYAEYRDVQLDVGAHLILSVGLSRGFNFVAGVYVSVYPMAETARKIDAVTGIDLSFGTFGAAFATFGLEYSL